MTNAEAEAPSQAYIKYSQKLYFNKILEWFRTPSSGLDWWFSTFAEGQARPWSWDFFDTANKSNSSCDDTYWSVYAFGPLGSKHPTAAKWLGLTQHVSSPPEGWVGVSSERAAGVWHWAQPARLCEFWASKQPPTVRRGNKSTHSCLSGNSIACREGVPELTRPSLSLAGLEVEESMVYSCMIQAAAQQRDTCLTITPTVLGERHLPDQLASVTGISSSDLSLGHVTRALCRGIVQNLHSMLPFGQLREWGVERVIGSGSALSRNEVLKQEVQRAFPLPVSYGQDVDAAVGAALVMLQRSLSQQKS